MSRRRNYTAEKYRAQAQLEARRHLHAGYPIEKFPPKVVEARRKLEDRALAREVGVPVEEILC